MSSSRYRRGPTDTVAAAGASLAAATLLTSEINLVTAADGTKGVRLPTPVAGGPPIVIINNEASSNLLVFPASGGEINEIGDDLSFTLSGGQSVVLYPYTSTQWYTVGASPGISDVELSFLDGVTAGTGAASKAAVLNSSGDWFGPNNGGIVIGHTAQITLNALIPELQVLGTVVGVDSAMAAVLYSSTAAEGPQIILARSKSDTLGTNTIVANNDSLGRIVAMGADGGTGFDPAAAIEFQVAGTPGATTDMPGRIAFQTSPDGSQTPATRMTILSGATTVAQAQLGTAGTSTGALLFGGVTSGVVTLSVAAAAGTWTMQLPAAVGSAGQQLTDAGANGVCTWAASSLGAWKNDLGILDPHEALEAVVKAPTHKFTYNAEVMPPGQWAPKDLMTGIFAEEAPWAMHGERDGLRSGIAFSAVNSFGYARAAIQALYEDLVEMKALLAKLLPA